MKLDLRSVLKRRNMRASQLADNMEVSRGYISEVMSGKKFPSPKMLERIATALDASPHELFGSEDIQPAILTSAFSEPASAYVIKAQDAQTERKIADSAHHHQIWRAARSHLAFGILKGDELHIDLHHISRDSGLVLATRVDTETGEGVTLLRRIEHGHLYSEDPSDTPENWSSSTHNYAILGKILGVVRRL